ncbi:MAG: response regulator transcription factor [Chloroflexota bacterium]
MLIIDDDYAMTDLLKMVLEPQNFEVHTINSGSSIAEVVREIDPEIVIIDLLMPGKDGWQVCREIRRFSQVPILILSVVDKPGMVEHALDAGADEYLLKPVPTYVLTARLNTLVRRARAEKMAAVSDRWKKNGCKHQIEIAHIWAMN